MSGIDPAIGGTPAPYGRACLNCARAKCRCIYRTSDAGPDASCERCYRLKKNCEPSQTVRKRNGRRQVGSRTAQLEEKLEDLVSLLRNQNQNHNASVKPPAGANTSSVAPHEHSPPRDIWVNTPDPSYGDAAGSGSNDDRNSVRSPLGPQSAAGIFNSSFTVGLFNHQSSTVPIPISSMIQHPWMPSTIREAEEQLALFRDEYLLLFPCVYIPPDMSSEQLRAEKPFTWFTIMMMTCQTSSVQFGMGAVWQRIISQKIVVEHEKNLDLLQGMVIFLSWSQYHKKDKPYLAIFSQIAISQVYDLQLNKLQGDPGFNCFKPSTFNQYMYPRPRTMEDRRTVVACWYITSQIAFTLKKIDGLRWTSHLNDCMNYLNEHPEWHGDRLLSAQVRIQLLIDQAAADGQTTGMPPYYQLSALTSPVEAVKKQLAHLAPGILDNEMIRIHLLYAEVALLENGLSRTPYNPKKPDLRRYEILSRTADAVRNWFAEWWSLSDQYFTALSFSMWCQLAHNLMSLYKITTLDEPGWDRSAVRRDIDLLDICERIGGDMNTAAALRAQKQPDLIASPPGTVPTDTDIFSACSRMMLTMKNVWSAELAALDMPDDVADPQLSADKLPPPTAVNGFVDNITTGPLAVPMDFIDDAWLNMFNVSWE
ncbi:hypothetical protein GE09DRAFT_1218375 [Coniochaeta sp. 2T2.1]|nr:hypothetical protein GE09DRAFT_1218375 [Coniochaeta sp. 2T2.1]